MGKLELIAETTAGYHLLTFHVLRDAHIQGKPPLLSGSDCVKLGLVKIRADEIHSFGTSPGAATHQKPHPKPPVQLPTPENSPNRDTPIIPDPIPAPRMFDNRRPNISLPFCPAKMTLEWVLEAFPDVHTGLEQFGKPVAFDLGPNVTPVHNAIHWQPVARHAKTKEQLDKMESKGKICRQHEPTAWCSVAFQWTDSHDQAFVEPKELIAHAPVLCYFNPQLPVTLQVDASGVGVGGALLQNDQPVAFYSNTLTETEQRYAVIEKECLAICLVF